MIEDLSKVLLRETVAKNICADLNNFTDLRSTLVTVLTHLKDLTECEAVAIRLHDDGDYPYYVYRGFDESFILKENSLCAKDGHGRRIKDENGSAYLLDCMCGNIIRGRYDATLPFFSQAGSFWSNHTTKLLASTTEKERQARTRNYCNSCGYESVALVPIRIQDERIGLIQFNDHRLDMYDETLIEYLEMIGRHIGLAVRNAMNYTRLQEALEEIRTLQGILPICSSCKSIRDDKGYWHRLEDYIESHSLAKLSHGLCEACVEKLYPEYKRGD